MGVKTPSKLASKRVEKLFPFLCSLFLVPRRSFDGFEASFCYFPSILVSSGLRNYGFCIGKEHFSKLVLLCFSQRPTAVWAPFGLILCFAKIEIGSKTFAKGVSKWCLKIEDILFFFGGDF